MELFKVLSEFFSTHIHGPDNKTAVDFSSDERREEIRLENMIYLVYG